MFKRLIVLILVSFIAIYQKLISPFLGKKCRFYPSCSVYAQDAFNKYGVRKGFILTVKRLAKCGPWHPGGIDYVRSSL